MSALRRPTLALRFRRKNSTRKYLPFVPLIAVALTVASVCRLANGAPVESSAQSSIGYHRIFVPSERVDAWPREDDKYLPLEASEFERLVASANRSHELVRARASVRSADYSASFNGQELRDGRATWEIDLKGEDPAVLDLGAFFTLMSNPVWRGRAAEPVRSGLWGKAEGAATNAALFVPRSGALEFDWTSRVEKTEGGFQLSLRMPPAAVTRLTLDLPIGMRPEVDQGIVLESNDVGQSRRWVIAPGRASETLLKIIDARAGGAIASPTSTVREEFSYQITERGLDIVATLEIGTPSPARKSVSVPLPAGVRLLEADCDGQELTWNIDSKDARGTVALLKIPNLENRRNARITLRAWQAMELVTTWSLPTLRPTDMFWTAGTIHVSISPKLELRALNITDCRREAMTSSAHSEAGAESWTFESFSPSANVELAVGPRQAEVAAYIGTKLSVGESGITGQSLTHLHVDRGSVYEIVADVPAEWVIEGVETSPASVLESWQISDDAASQRLALRMAQSVREGEEFTIFVNGRLQRSDPLAPIELPLLKLLQWQKAETHRELLRIETSEPLVVSSTIGLPLAERSELSASELKFFEEVSGGTIHDLASAEPNAAVGLISQRGNYTSDIRVDASIAASNITVSYEIACVPLSSPVEHLIVQATEPLGHNVEWSLADGDDQVIASRVTTSEPRSATLPPRAELWRLKLRRPTTAPIVLRAATSIPFSQRTSVPLLSSPDAVEQTGRLVLHSAHRTLPIIETQALISTAFPNVATNAPELASGSLVAASYRYDPMRMQGSGLAQLWLTPRDELSKANNRIASRVTIESYYAMQGRGTHRATYRLETSGDDVVEFRLPEGASLLTAKVDGEQIIPIVARNGDGALSRDASTNGMRIPLPLEKREVTVSLEYQTRPITLRNGLSLNPPRPAIDADVLVGEWIVVIPDAFMLTSVDTVDQVVADWRHGLLGSLGAVFDSLLDASVESTGTSSSSIGYEDAEITAANSTSSSSSGNPHAVADAFAPPSLGWRSHRSTFFSDSPIELTVVRPAIIRVWSLAALLVGLVFGTRLKTRRERFVLAISATAAGALLAPAIYSPVAVGACVGLLLSLLVPSRRRRAGAKLPSSSSRPMAGALTSTLGLLLSTLSSTTLIADELAPPVIAGDEQAHDAQADMLPRVETLERVLIPVDSQRRVVGSKYFVSERLLQHLLQHDDKQSAVAYDWLLSNATLTGELADASDQPTAPSNDWTFTLDLEVLARDTFVALPLTSEEIEWPTTILLDGISVPIAENESKSQRGFAVREPGHYRATLAFAPRIARVGGRQHIELTVPPIDGASVSIAHPVDFGNLAVEGADEVESGDARGEFAGKLDGSGNLKVSWVAKATLLPTIVVPRVEELRWLRVGNDGAELTAKYVIDDSTDSVRSLSVRVDQNWRVLSPADGETAQADAPNEIDRLVDVPLIEVLSDVGARLEGVLRLKMHEAPAIGQLRLPRLELASITPGKYRFAVSTDPGIECQVLGTGAWAPGDVQDFIAAWGKNDEEDVPQLLLGEVSPRAQLNVAARPREAESKLIEVLHVAAGLDGLRLQYQADVEPNEQHRFQFAVDINANTIVDDILLSRGGEPAGLRWVRVTDRRVNVFFEEEIREPYRLVLTGHIPQSRDGKYSLPRVTAISSDAIARQFHFYRDDEVLVELSTVGEINQPAELTPIAWNARWVRGLSLDDAEAKRASLLVSPNEVQVTGQSLISLEQSDNGWESVYTFQATVAQGELTSLHFRAPAEWAGGFQVESAATIEMSTALLDDDQLLLTARLAKAIVPGESVELTMRAPLPVGSSPVRVPEVSIQTPATNWQSFVSVPVRIDGRLVSWSLTGVSPAELPASLLPERTLSRIGQTFQVIASPFRVAVQPQSTSSLSSSVRLADTLLIQNGDTRITSTQFVIAAHALADCTVQLADNEELVQLRLDGHAAIANSIDSKRWRVQLGPPQLPQVLEVTSRSAHGASRGGSLRLQRPILLAGDRSIPVELSLWTLAQPSSNDRPDASAIGLTTALEQAALRLDRLVSITEAAFPSAAESKSADGFNWFHPWAARLAATCSQCRELLATDATEQAAQQVSASATDQILACEVRIEKLVAQARDQWPEIDAGEWQSMELAAVESVDASMLPDHGIHKSHLVAAGGEDEIAIRLLPTHVSSSLIRSVGLLAIAAAAAGSIWLTRRPAACDLLWRWPHAVGVLVGLTCWVWLAPSWLGWIIIAGSLLTMFRSGWQEKVVP